MFSQRRKNWKRFSCRPGYPHPEQGKKCSGNPEASEGLWLQYQDEDRPPWSNWLFLFRFRRYSLKWSATRARLTNWRTGSIPSMGSRSRRWFSATTDYGEWRLPQVPRPIRFHASLFRFVGDELFCKPLSSASSWKKRLFSSWTSHPKYGLAIADRNEKASHICGHNGYVIPVKTCFQIQFKNLRFMDSCLCISPYVVGNTHQY